MNFANILSEISDSQKITGGLRNESMTWLTSRGSLPIWSRRRLNTPSGVPLYATEGKWHNFDVEMRDHLWSLWGGMHPKSRWFQKVVRGKQTLGCCMVACCVASVYRRLADWNSKLLDAIVVNGDRYYRECVERNDKWGQELLLGDLNVNCRFENINFMVQPDFVAFGKLYGASSVTNMNLSEALNYFFTRFENGILQCNNRVVAFGYSPVHDGGYYMYDCQEWDTPIFPPNMGSSYLLLTKELHMLLYCMVVTLNIRRRNVEFRLHNVEIVRLPETDNDD